jgi:hypothetical protein
MKKTALKIFIAAIVFVICSCVFYYVGEQAEPPQVVEVDVLSDGGKEWTTWHHLSAGLMFMAMPLAIASAMVWSRNRIEE